MTGPNGAKTGKAAAKAKKRSKIVRWQGILLFVAVSVLLAVLWRLFLNPFTERTIEKTGAAIVGAQVDLDAARVSLSPLGVTLTRLQVTNPKAPTTNIVEAGRISFHMDGPNALRHKTIVEEMRVENVRLNTPRKSPGFVVQGGKSVVEKLAELPSFVIPTVP